MRGAAQVDAIKRLARAEGLAILSASTDREFAYEVKSLDTVFSPTHFSRARWCRVKGEEIVSVFGLLQYVDRHLPGIAKKYIRREQRSVQTFQGQDFPLFALSKSDSPLVTPDKGAASTPDTPAKKVELTVATEKKIRAHIEQKAPVVFVCSDAAALSIRGKVAADGVMRFEAYKPAQPRAAARCIQTALGEVTVGRKYVGLEVIHPMGRPPKPAPATDAPPKLLPEAPN